MNAMLPTLLPSYFRRRVAVQILARLAVLTALLQMLELLDMTTEVLKREQGLSGLLYYAALRTAYYFGRESELAGTDSGPSATFASSAETSASNPSRSSTAVYSARRIASSDTVPPR